ncbi:MAG: helix-turn-helix transcriptional regulator [Gammaproteobacteria bacterium]
MAHLGEFELVTMLAIAQLGDNAYGVTIRDLLESQTSRCVALGGIYKTLARLEAKRFVEFSIAPPTGERGGRRKKLYRPTSAGVTAMRTSLADLSRLTEGLERGSLLT